MHNHHDMLPQHRSFQLQTKSSKSGSQDNLFYLEGSHLRGSVVLAEAYSSMLTPVFQDIAHVGSDKNDNLQLV